MAFIYFAAYFNIQILNFGIATLCMHENGIWSTRNLGKETHLLVVTLFRTLSYGYLIDFVIGYHYNSHRSCVLNVRIHLQLAPSTMPTIQMIDMN